MACLSRYCWAYSLCESIELNKMACVITLLLQSIKREDRIANLQFSSRGEKKQKIRENKKKTLY